jgi:hypothetical protein
MSKQPGRSSSVMPSSGPAMMVSSAAPSASRRDDGPSARRRTAPRSATERRWYRGGESSTPRAPARTVAQCPRRMSLESVGVRVVSGHGRSRVRGPSLPARKDERNSAACPAQLLRCLPLWKRFLRSTRYYVASTLAIQRIPGPRALAIAICPAARSGGVYLSAVMGRIGVRGRYEQVPQGASRCAAFDEHRDAHPRYPKSWWRMALRQ